MRCGAAGSWWRAGESSLSERARLEPQRFRSRVCSERRSSSRRCARLTSDSLRSSGPPLVLLTDAEAFASDVREHFAGGADLIFDTTGYWVEGSVGAIARFGRIVTIAAPKDGHVSLPLLDLYRVGGVLVGVNSLLYDVEACAEMLEPIAEAFDLGEIPPPMPARQASLDEAPDVYRAVDAGSTDKVVFVMSD